MSKNIVFMINVKTGAGKPEYDISIESWRRWCDKNDAELFVLEELVLPMEEMHIIWQRYFLFDIFDEPLSCRTRISYKIICNALAIFKLQ